MALPQLTVSPTVVPKRTVNRTKNPNQFTPLVAGLTVDNPESALFFVLPGATAATEPTPNGKATRYVDSDVREALRLLAEAGDDNKVSVRKKVETVSGGVKVSFWAVTRITRTTND